MAPFPRFSRPAGWKLLAYALLCFCSCIAAKAADDSRVDFHLPNGPAETTLPQFSQQAACELVYSVELVKGVQTNAVTGNYTASAALERMLAGTQLKAIQDEATGALTIARIPPPSDDSTAKKKTQNMNLRKYLAPAAIAAASTLGASGQTAPDPATGPSTAQEEPVRLSPFEVNESSNVGYGAASTASTSRIVQNYIDVPQTVNVVTSQFINDYNIQDARAALMDIPNVTFGLPNNSTAITARAAAVTTIYIDGVPSPSVFTAMPLQFFDRIELVKGPSSAAFGLGQPGGLMNYVSKTPQGTEQGNLTLGIGTNENFLANFDIQGVSAQDPKLSYRVVGFWDHGGYMQYGDIHSGEGGQLALKYAYDPDTALNLIVSYSNTVWPNRSGVENIWKDPETYHVWQLSAAGSSHSYLPGTVFPNGAVFGVSGTPPPPGTPGPAGIGLYGTGNLVSVNSDPNPLEWQGDTETVLRANLIGTKDLADNHIHLRVSQENEWNTGTQYDSAGVGLNSNYNVPAMPANLYGATVPRSYGFDAPSDHRLEFDADGEVHFLGGDWETELGADGYETRYSNYGYSIPSIDRNGNPVYLSIYGKNSYSYVPTNQESLTSQYSDLQDGWGVYAQESASFFKKMVTLTAGWRLDKFDTVINNAASDTHTNSGWLVSNPHGAPRFAVTVKPLKWLSIYALHTVHYDPAAVTSKYFVDTGLFTSLSPANQAKYPITQLESYTPGGVTNEVGVKASFLGGKIYASVDFFQETVAGQINPLDVALLQNTDGTTTYIAENFVQTTKVSGCEAEIFGQVTNRLIFTANYGIVRGYYPAFSDGDPDYVEPSASISAHGKYDFSNSRGTGVYVTFGGLLHMPYLLWQAQNIPGFGQVYVYDDKYQWLADGGIGYQWRSKKGYPRRLYLSATNIFNRLMSIGTITPWTMEPLRAVTLTYSVDFK